MSADKLFVPKSDTFSQDPPKLIKAEQMQYPPKKITAPYVKVGIMSAPVIQFRFVGEFRCLETGGACSESNSATFENGKIRFDNQLFDQLSFCLLMKNSCFNLRRNYWRGFSLKPKRTTISGHLI